MIRQKSCYISICCSLDHKVFMLIAILHPDVFLHIGKKKKKGKNFLVINNFVV